MDFKKRALEVLQDLEGEKRRAVDKRAKGSQQAPGGKSGGLHILPSRRDDRTVDEAALARQKMGTTEFNPEGYFAARQQQAGVPSTSGAALGPSRGPSAPGPRPASAVHSQAVKAPDAAAAFHRAQQHQQVDPDVQGKTPIIVVPAALSSKLNMYNAKAFLEEGVYRRSEDVRAEGGAKASSTPLKRKYGRTPAVDYLVTDKYPTEERYQKRVVAVFVQASQEAMAVVGPLAHLTPGCALLAQGSAWQFKEWDKRFKGAASGNLVGLFNEVRGFFVRYSDEKVPDQVKSWNVKVLTLEREIRHKDEAVVREFWDSLDQILRKRNSQLKF